MSIKQNLQTVVIASVVSLAVGGTGAYAATSLVQTHDIAKGAVTSAKVKDGTIRKADLSPAILAALAKHAKDGVNGTNGSNGAAGQDGAAGAPGSVAGVQKNWVEKDGAVLNDAHSVTLTNAETPAGASLEIDDLNKRVQALQTLSFTYDLDGDAQYAAGSPRVFFQINDAFYNTFDADPSDAGTDNGDGTFTKTVTIQANGTIHAAGVVMDSGVGSVTVTNLTINGSVIDFS